MLVGLERREALAQVGRPLGVLLDVVGVGVLVDHQVVDLVDDDDRPAEHLVRVRVRVRVGVGVRVRVRVRVGVGVGVRVRVRVRVGVGVRVRVGVRARVRARFRVRVRVSVRPSTSSSCPSSILRMKRWLMLALRQ